MTKKRVLFLPIEIAGYAGRLQSTLSGFGWEADVLDLSGDPLGYGAVPPQFPLISRMRRLAAWSARSPWRQLVGTALSLPWRIWITLFYLPRYDALVYLFGTTLLGGGDLRYARRRGVRIVAVFLGSDSRPPYMSGRYADAQSWRQWQQVRFVTARTSRRIRRFEHFADEIVCSPTSAQFLTRPFVNWFAVGMPSPVAEPAGSPTLPPPPSNGRVRVAHAPTRPAQKGTEAITRALATCAAGVELETVSGVSNSEVARLLRRSDFVVDELYSDTPIGGLGVESAQLGRAAFTFGYAADFLGPSLARFGVPTRSYAHPSELDRVLRQAVQDPAWRAEVAAENRRFVTEHWSAAGVAGRLAHVLNGSTPRSWLSDPAVLDYCLGWGMSAATAGAFWREYLRRFGPAGLQLPADSPVASAIQEASVNADSLPQGLRSAE